MTRFVYLDTNVFIKGFEADDEEAGLAWQVMEALTAGSIGAVTSELTLAEILPRPLANDDRALADTYRSLLQTGRGLVVAAVTRDILVASAELRALHPDIRLPDAIHMATATAHRCRLFLSGDRRIRSSSNFEVIRLRPDSLATIRAGAA